MGKHKVEDRKYLGRYLAFLRYKQSETRQIMANGLNLSLNQLDSIERGSSFPSAYFRNSIIERYHLTDMETEELDNAISQTIERMNVDMSGNTPVLKALMYKIVLYKDELSDEKCQDISRYIDEVIASAKA